MKKPAKKLLPGFTLVEPADPSGYSMLADCLMAGPKPTRESNGTMKERTINPPSREALLARISALEGALAPFARIQPLGISDVQRLGAFTDADLATARTVLNARIQP